MSKTAKSKNHMAELLLPLALFFFFAICALAVVLFAAKVYKNTVNSSYFQSPGKMAASYIAEKIHRNDGGVIEVVDFDGTEAICIGSIIDETLYNTYIYYYDGSLREIIIPEGTSAVASAGSRIMDISGFKVDEIRDGLFSVTCSPDDIGSYGLIVGARANNE